MAGCGGSDDETIASPAERAAFIAKADPLCKTYEHRLARVSQHFEAVLARAGAARANAVIARQYVRQGELLEGLVVRLRRARVPVGDEDAIGPWLAARARQAADQLELAAALYGPDADPDAVAELKDRLATDAAEAAEAIQGYGFDYCGLRPGAP